VTTDERRRLRGIVAREIEAPGDYPKLREDLQDALPRLEPALRLLALKDEEHRTAFYVKSEALWYRRFGFRMMRPLFLVSLVAAVLFLLQDAIDPALALGCFVIGAFAFYVVLQVFAWRWSRADEKKLGEIRHRYRQRLERLRDELDDRSQ
jgi:hypothetical protein